MEGRKAASRIRSDREGGEDVCQCGIDVVEAELSEQTKAENGEQTAEREQRTKNLSHLDDKQIGRCLVRYR